MTKFLPDPHPSYDPYGRRTQAPDISREEANALMLQNRQADPNVFRNYLFDMYQNMGADPGQASLFSAPMAALPFVGDVQDLEDARMAAGEGNWLQAGVAGAMAAVPFIPGRAITKGLNKGKKAPIKAYHGSPHDFDEFRMDRIGTGEGAQAYGHGLYFAENEDVARSYRDELIQGQNNVMTIRGDDGNILRQGSTIDDVDLEAYKWLEGAGPTHNEPIKAEYRASQAKRNLAARGPKGEYADRIASRIDELADGAVVFDYETPRGRMYEVNINADPADFLDWDAPLSEQPPHIRKAFGKAKAGDDELLNALLGDDTTPMEYFGLYSRSPGGQAYNTFADGADDAASRKLRDAGIPGIKYLDGGSRIAGEGTRNFVVFDDKLVSIVKKYGIAGAISMGLISQQQGEQMQAQGLI